VWSLVGSDIILDKLARWLSKLMLLKIDNPNALGFELWAYEELCGACINPRNIERG
jgi:hypothetical protein